MEKVLKNMTFCMFQHVLSGAIKTPENALESSKLAIKNAIDSGTIKQEKEQQCVDLLVSVYYKACEVIRNSNIKINEILG